MIFILYSVALLLLAALPLVLVTRNLPLFERAPAECSAESPVQPISVLIPARNEAQGIATTVQSILNSNHEPFEIIVLDDHSTDETAAIVQSIACQDTRVSLERSPVLPEGWNGKQHACWQLASLARHDYFLFLDADVQLLPDALRRTQAALARSQADLISGFPRQITQTLSESLLVPMMHYVLLGYLPLEKMRCSPRPEFGAGCGQLFLAKRAAYMASGGHGSIHASRHDGLKLPRSFREAGFRTDLFNADDIAQVRMYRGLPEVTRGVLKNANEGMANKRLIGLFTVLLLGGAVLPFLSFAHAVSYHWMSLDNARFLSTILLGIATMLSFLTRYQIARHLHQSMLGVWLHPVAVAWFVVLQWFAFVRELLGKEAIPWRGRT